MFKFLYFFGWKFFGRKFLHSFPRKRFGWKNNLHNFFGKKKFWSIFFFRWKFYDWELFCEKKFMIKLIFRKYFVFGQFFLLKQFLVELFFSTPTILIVKGFLSYLFSCQICFWKKKKFIEIVWSRIYFVTIWCRKCFWSRCYLSPKFLYLLNDLFKNFFR